MTTIHLFFKRADGTTAISRSDNHQGRGGESWTAEDYLNLIRPTPYVRANWLRIEVSRDPRPAYGGNINNGLFLRQAFDNPAVTAE
jgi:hypothetical protein